MSSCRMKPVAGSAPSASMSSTAQMPAAVVIWMALRDPGDDAAIDLVGVGLLDQAAVLAAGDRDEDDDHVLQRAGSAFSKMSFSTSRRSAQAAGRAAAPS
jgi:hypothetical protein